MDTNAIYRVRFNETLRFQQLIVPERLGPDADVSTISHCQDFEGGLPVRPVFTEVVYESKTPPMHLPHLIVQADDPQWELDHVQSHEYETRDNLPFWDPLRGIVP